MWRKEPPRRFGAQGVNGSANRRALRPCPVEGGPAPSGASEHQASASDGVPTARGRPDARSQPSGPLMAPARSGAGAVKPRAVRRPVQAFLRCSSGASPSPTGPAPAPPGCQRRSNRRSERVRGHGRRRGRNHARDRAVADHSRAGDRWPVAGFVWPLAAASARSPKIMSAARWHHLGPRGGASGTHSRMPGVAISTASRSRQPGSRSLLFSTAAR